MFPLPLITNPPRPNVILILADDLGFSDLGCYGGEIRTPNVDHLAKDGVRFAQFYNRARCCPTRASLLTGLYPHQAGIGEMNQDRGLPAYRGELNDRCATIAEVLKTNGYRTGMAGKWHVVNLNISSAPAAQQKAMINFEIDAPLTPRKENWPTNRGFEEFWGTIPGVESFWDPYGLVHNLETIQRDRSNFYYTDFITQHSVQMIDRFAQDKNNPFFMYVAYTAPHWPIQAPEAEVQAYVDMYRKGWDKIRAERYDRLVQLGIVNPAWPLSARASNPGLADRDSQVSAWDTAKNKEWEIRRMATYAAMVEHMDRGIGSIVGQLKRRNIEKNTIVIFLSDNGACQENVQPGWYDIPSRTRDGKTIHVGNTAQFMPGGDETVYQSYGPMWANTSNTPFRRFKHFTEEGGISTPFVVRWPNGKLAPGRIELNRFGDVIDLMPTILDAAGATYPKSINGKEIQPLEGQSLLPAMRGKPYSRKMLFWEHEGNRAARDGDWKIVSASGEPWQLYNIVRDRTELKDLSEQEPARKKRMIAQWEDWARRVGVLPRPR